jgi:hypothetical protein
VLGTCDHTLGVTANGSRLRAMIAAGQLMLHSVRLHSARTRSFTLLLCIGALACAPDWGSGDYRENEKTSRDDTKGETKGDAAAMSPDVDDGLCKPGTLRCDELGSSVQVCTAADGWRSKELCDSICTDGACGGSCKPGSKRCGAMQAPQKCSSDGTWMALDACDFACTGEGTCAGSCKPGDKRCSPKASKVPSVCDEMGKWVDADACTNVCMDGECTGTCAPGAMRCGADNTPEQCSTDGIWEPQEACPFVCSAKGECVGECLPGSRDCDGQTPRMCDPMGMWKPGTACKSSTCSMGVCMGMCEPQQARCGANETPEQCDETGEFAAKEKCPYVCDGDGMCAGKCSPNSVTCSGTTLRTCKADGSGYDDKACPAPTAKNESATCVANRCGQACLPPMVTCGGSSLCWNLPMGCEQCKDGYGWRAAPGALTGDRVCVPKDSLAAIQRRMAEQDAASAGLSLGIPGFCAQGAVSRNAYLGDLTCISATATPDPSQAENSEHRFNTQVSTGQN